MRAGYWYENLPKQYNYSVSVITNESEAIGERVHFVKCEGTSILSRLIADPGVIWKKNIKQYLDNSNIETPDVVIITGGPFMHFALTPWLKKKYNCKVILDYRDPFATNPGFNNSGVKASIKRSFERRFNKSADALVTVNKFCGKIIEAFNQKPNAIVQNGFNDTVSIDKKNHNFSFPHFVYAGKFYFPPNELVEALHDTQMKLTYLGPESKTLQADKQIFNLGFVDYKKAISEIASSDVGIIQTYGHEFQSTTKIFDYIRCGLAILIISDDKLYEGSIHEELEGYPNVFWCKNEKVDIVKALTEIKNTTFQPVEPEFANKFSRKEQTKNLIKLIDQLYND